MTLISRIDHVSIAVKDYEEAFNFFSKLLGSVPGAGMEDPNMKYVWQLFSLGDLSRLELMHPTGTGSFLDGFLKDKKGGVHHITLETPDIEKFRQHLEEQGIPYFGFGSMGEVWKELFIHPKHAFGVLIQVAEFNPDDWLAESEKMPPGKRFSVSANNDGCTVTFSHPGGGKSSISLAASEARQLVSDINDALKQSS